MGRGREWLIAILAGLVIASVAYAGVRGRIADEWKERADSTRIAYDAFRETTVERELELQGQVDSITTAFQAELDSLAAVPPPTPRLSVRYETVLDTATLNREVRQAVDSLRAERDALRVENDTLRVRLATLEERTNEVIANLRQVHEHRITNLQETIARAEETIAIQAEALEKRSGTSWKTRLFYTAVGAGLYALYDATQSEDNTTVVINEPPRGCGGGSHC